MSGHVVAIARRPGGPVPVRIQRTADLDWAGDPARSAERVAGRVPLRVVEGGGAVPGLSELRRAWDAMDSARIGPDSVARLLLVLRGTVLVEPVPSGLNRLAGTELARPFRPSAAHPRAYEGTAARPPKPRAPRRFDLRSVALDPRASRVLVARFAGGVGAADALLAERDSPARWDGTALPAPHRMLVWQQLRPLPGRAAATVLGRLRHASTGVALAAGWWLAHALPQPPPVGRGAGDPAAGLAWLGAALALPDPLPEIALFLAAEAGVRDLRAVGMPLLEVATATGDDPRAFAQELWTLLDAHRRGVSAPLLLPGLELLRGTRRGRQRSMAGVRPAALVPAAAIRALARAHPGSDWRGREVDIWRTLSRHPRLNAAVMAQPWAAIETGAADRLLSGIASVGGSGARARWWTEALPEMIALVQGRPLEYAHKVADALVQAANLIRAASRLPELWPPMAAIASRLGAPPFRPDAQAVGVWHNLVVHAPAALVQTVIGAPDRAWLELERRSRVPTQADVLSHGLDALGRAHGARLAEAFQRRSPLLYEVAGLLGAMSDSSAARVCGAHGGAGDAATWLERIRDGALADLGRGLDADLSQPRVRHALMLHRALGDNRRALRRFLRAHLDGDPDYVGRHPLTRRWLAAHPKVAAPGWTAGIALEAAIDGIGPLTLRVETDPLEALRLGTHVGSCLGVRGLCDYAAVAAALDVNKQVVYARNRRGSVIARQLLAISENDELVPFEVYPRSSPQPVQALFARYDRAFAAELGLAIWTGHDGEEDGYTVAEVISRSWWDDGAWEMATEQL